MTRDQWLELGACVLESASDWLRIGCITCRGVRAGLGWGRALQHARGIIKAATVAGSKLAEAMEQQRAERERDSDDSVTVSWGWIGRDRGNT